MKELQAYRRVLRLRLCEMCWDDHDKRERKATWYISGVPDNCGNFACCGWEENACDEHKEQALQSMPEHWNLTAVSIE